MASFSYLIQDISELDLVAKQILELSQRHKIFLFDGKMGSGKTTLIKKVVHLLGVFESSSPTFSIINTYLGYNNQSIYHIDCYRIENENEVENIGLLEILNDQKLCFIEWPNKIHNFLPDTFVSVSISFDNNLRKITIES